MAAAKRKRGKSYIGTSGWIYPHWRERFYPKELKQKEWLDYYQQYFHSAEINNSFYNLPEMQTLEHWRDTVGKNFSFAVKASRYITHMKKLKEPGYSTQRFFERMQALDKQMGPILFQLPPKWGFNADRLANFLRELPPDHRYTFEFRDHSWFNDEAYELLEEHNAACCLYHLSGYQSPEVVTADFVYIRLHGPGDAYQGNYHKPTLAKWADRIQQWNAEGRDVYCYFDNDEAGYAPRNALRLQALLEPVGEHA